MLLRLLVRLLVNGLLVQGANSGARQDRQRVLVLLALGLLRGLLRHDSLVVCRQDFDEAGKSTCEVEQDACGQLGASVVVVVLDETAQEGNLLRILQTRQLHHLGVDLTLEVVVQVQDVGDASGHTSSEVPAGAAEDNDTTASHVLASVVADTFDDCSGTRVADGEALCSYTAEEAGTARSAVEAHVADDDVLLGFEDCRARRIHDQAAARQHLPNVVVGIAL